MPTRNARAGAIPAGVGCARVFAVDQAAGCGPHPAIHCVRFRRSERAARSALRRTGIGIVAALVFTSRSSAVPSRRQPGRRAAVALASSYAFGSTRIRTTRSTRSTSGRSRAVLAAGQRVDRFGIFCCRNTCGASCSSIAALVLVVVALLRKTARRGAARVLRHRAARRSSFSRRACTSATSSMRCSFRIACIRSRAAIFGARIALSVVLFANLGIRCSI